MKPNQNDGATKAAKRAVKPPSLAESVYARLRGEILSCKLEPGSEISESVLAERFEVSKTPVREALAKLRQEGLVRTFPRRGYQVTPITFGDMNELFDVRTIIEAGATELACEHITDDELNELRSLATVAYSPDETPTIETFIAANRTFHLAIAKASRNVRLYDLLARQIYELERFFHLGAQLRDVNTETNTNHLDIVEALAARDREKARALMIEHNEVTRQGLFQALVTSRRFHYVGI